MQSSRFLLHRVADVDLTTYIHSTAYLPSRRTHLHSYILSSIRYSTDQNSNRSTPFTNPPPPANHIPPLDSSPLPATRVFKSAHQHILVTLVHHTAPRATLFPYSSPIIPSLHSQLTLDKYRGPPHVPRSLSCMHNYHRPSLTVKHPKSPPPALPPKTQPPTTRRRSQADRCVHAPSSLYPLVSPAVP